MNISTVADEIQTSALGRRAALLKQARQLHLYLGTLFAPTIVFFALTGALQLFGLHEGHPGDAYQTPAWIAKLASIHKNQILAEPHSKPPEMPEEHRPMPQQRHHKEFHPGKATYVLKAYFLLMSMGLVVTTCLGVYMAFKFNRSRRLIWSLLVTGTAFPVGLVAFMI